MSPWSRSSRTNSSANSGFPPDRSRIGCCTSAGTITASRSPDTSLLVSVSVSGASSILVRFSRSRPKSG
jgi:hypothetical protein